MRFNIKDIVIKSMHPQLEKWEGREIHKLVWEDYSMDFLNVFGDADCFILYYWFEGKIKIEQFISSNKKMYKLWLNFIKTFKVPIVVEIYPFNPLLNVYPRFGFELIGINYDQGKLIYERK